MTLERWLSLRFGLVVLFALTGLCLLFGLFDLLAWADDLAREGAGAGGSAMVGYLRLRLPDIVLLVLPLAVLATAMWIFSRMAAESEMVALQAAGYSPARVVFVFGLAAAALGAGRWLWMERVAVPAAEVLAEWRQRDYAGAPGEGAVPGTEVWTESGERLLRIRRREAASGALIDVSAFGLDAEGNLRRYRRAPRAVWRGGQWVLLEVRGLDLATGRRLDAAAWASGLRRADPMQTVVDAPGAMGWQTLGERAREAGGGRYRSWWWARWSGPLDPLVMVVLAGPVALSGGRGGRGFATGARSFCLGLLYLAAVRGALVAGENGVLAPVWAAFGPAAVFGLAGLGFLWHLRR